MRSSFLIIDEIDASSYAASLFEDAFKLSRRKHYGKSLAERIIFSLIETMMKVDNTGKSIKASEWLSIVNCTSVVNRTTHKSLIEASEKIKADNNTFYNFIEYLKTRTK